MKIDDFEDGLLTSFRNFINTMKSHSEVGKREDLTYADWFDTFRAHEEVGNEMELEYHGQRVLNVHGPVCQLCASSLESQGATEHVKKILHWCSSVDSTFQPRMTVPRVMNQNMIPEEFLVQGIRNIRYLCQLLKVEE